jgi:hypothetical protein
VLHQHSGGFGIEYRPALLVRLRVLLGELAVLVNRPGAMKVTTLLSKSMCFQRSTHSSPRRAPMVIAHQTNAPQSGSGRASLMTRAASATLGGCGSGWGNAGLSAYSAGLTAIHTPASRSFESSAQDQ